MKEKSEFQRILESELKVVKAKTESIRTSIEESEAPRYWMLRYSEALALEEAIKTALKAYKKVADNGTR